MIDTAAKCATPEEVRTALTLLMPPLADFWSRPVWDYAAFVYQTARRRPVSAARAFAMNRLQDAVIRVALRAGYGHQEAQAAAEELYASPVVQTGPHCLMLYEPDAFYTHLFSMLGLRAHSRSWHVAYAGSTMSFNESAKKGPGWLRIGGEALNVFGLARSRMDGSSICCSNGPFRFALTNAAAKIAPNAAAADLLAHLPSSSFPSGAEAVKTANTVLWEQKFSSAAKLLQLDDFDLADLIADYLDFSSSWLTSAFFADGGAEHMLQAIEDLNGGPWGGWIRPTTDFFWHVGRDRIQPLRLEDGFLRSASSVSVSMEFSPPSLLRDQVTAPCLMICETMTGLRSGDIVFCDRSMRMPFSNWSGGRRSRTCWQHILRCR